MESILTCHPRRHSFFVLLLDHLNFLAILLVNSEFTKRNWVERCDNVHDFWRGPEKRKYFVISNSHVFGTKKPLRVSSYRTDVLFLS